MSRITIEQLGPMLKQKRGNRGIRDVAQEIGISPATLSRIETGKQPDLDTFTKVCTWLKLDASEVLGCTVPLKRADRNASTGGAPVVYAHLRADRVSKAETARHLGELILAVQRAIASEGNE